MNCKHSPALICAVCRHSDPVESSRASATKTDPWSVGYLLGMREGLARGRAEGMEAMRRRICYHIPGLSLVRDMQDAKAAIAFVQSVPVPDMKDEP